MRAASQPSDPGDQDTASLQQLVPQADLVFAQPLEELDPSDTEQEKVLLISSDTLLQPVSHFVSYGKTIAINDFLCHINDCAT